MKTKCEHGKFRHQCATCSDCGHGKLKRHCGICGVCGHSKAVHDCKICEDCGHGHLKRNCTICSPICWRAENTLRKFNRYKDSAADRGHSFNITFDQFKEILALPCLYCGESQQGRGIDRWDSKVGYVLDNCRPCCGPCNIMKKTMDGREFFDHIQRMAEHMKLGELSDLIALDKY